MRSPAAGCLFPLIAGGERMTGTPGSYDRCLAGVSSFHIDPHGTLHLRMVSRYPAYDLREGSCRFRQTFLTRSPP